MLRVTGKHGSCSWSHKETCIIEKYFDNNSGQLLWRVPDKKDAIQKQDMSSLQIIQALRLSFMGNFLLDEDGVRKNYPNLLP